MSSPSHSDSGANVPVDHVALTLLEDEESAFYLQIPLGIIHALCLKPLKYLLFLGWCILGAEGVLSLQPDDHVGIDTDEDAVGGEVYHYVPAAPLLGTFFSLSCVHAGHLQHVIYLSTEGLTHAVDLEVIKARTNTPSESSATRDDFQTVLAERDVCCVWTGTTLGFSDGLHIIPFKRGSAVCPTTFCREVSDRLPSANSVVPADSGESSILRRGCDNTH